jgi:hypothetical protein
MGEGTGGIDRFRLARQAVLETVADMSDADRVSLVVFDVEPRTLLAMESSASAKDALAAEWPVRAAGGTGLAPALEAALAQFDPAREDSRLLVLVTDGFLDDVPIDAWRRRLEGAGVQLLAFAIGPDARLDDLERLAGPSGGRVLHVQQAAELPRLMRATVERQRARIERGAIKLRPLVPLASMGDGGSVWPDIDAYAVTRAREDSTVWLESEKGDPVIASRSLGLGRVLTVTTSIPAWTPGWATWSSWPQLAAGLVNYVSRRSLHEQLRLETKDDEDSMTVVLDYASAKGWRDAPDARLLVTPPSGAEFRVSLKSVAPGRFSTKLQDPRPGVYRLMAEADGERVGGYHLHRVRGELERAGVNPQLALWESRGLLRIWPAEGPAELAAIPVGTAATSRARWTLLGLVLFLAAVLIDRADLRGADGMVRLRNLLQRRPFAPAP